ncbi:hypothetical protein V9Z57_10590 [Streptococcus suis]|uniref:hypothetical protein n=1 Tax=Streptococcus suis TaxID=1307 RepID=UPI00300FCE29
MNDEIYLDKIVFTAIETEMKCKNYLMLKSHGIDIISDYYYVDEDFAVITFSRNEDKMTIRVENQECIVCVENHVVKAFESFLEGEDIDVQIEILIKQLFIGKWQIFIEDVANNSLVDAIQKHGFDDYSNGPDAIIYF